MQQFNRQNLRIYSLNWRKKIYKSNQPSNLEIAAGKKDFLNRFV
jgi:hypothetical protein